MPPTPTCSTSDEFETLLESADLSVRAAVKRSRTAQAEAHRLLKKPKAGPFPFHDAIDVPNAALEAITAVTGSDSPSFNLESDPRRVFEWVRDVIIKYGHECREEGRGLERERATPRIQPETALEALHLMERLNTLLSADT